MKNIKNKGSVIEKMEHRLDRAKEIVTTDPAMRRMGNYAKKNKTPKESEVGPSNPYFGFRGSY